MPRSDGAMIERAARRLATFVIVTMGLASIATMPAGAQATEPARECAALVRLALPSAQLVSATPLAAGALRAIRRAYIPSATLLARGEPMKHHTYRISVEHLEDKQGNPVVGQSLSFIATNHDEITEIVERIRASRQFEGDDAAAFAVGLKLFSEIMLKHKDNPLFSDFRPQFALFMKRLKATV